MSDTVLRARYDAGESINKLAQESGITWQRMRDLLGNPPSNRRVSDAAPDPAMAAWAAGFFDGEGCVHITGRGQLVLAVGQIAREPLQRLQTAFGGPIRIRPYTDGRRRDQFAWSLSGRLAFNALRVMRPWLAVKAGIADLAMATVAPWLGRRVGRGQSLTEAEHQERAAAHRAVLVYNRRGRAEAA